MAEEKIIKDEILKDEQLEQVAGGSEKQIEDDLSTFKRMGVIPASANLHDTGLLERAFSLYGITVKTHGGHWGKSNEYIVNSGQFAGQDVGQDGAWKIVNKVFYNYGDKKFTD